MLYVLITLKDGTQFVSQFSKLRGIGTYAGQVMTGKKALNVWKVLGNEHPASGEKVLVRQRKMLNGTEVASMEEVLPREDADPAAVEALDIGAFTQKPHIEKGPHGLYQFDAADETRPEGVSVRLPYPIYRDPDTLRRYVILTAAREGTPEVRHYLDAESIGMSPVPPTGDAEQERAEDFTEEYDDDETF